MSFLVTVIVGAALILCAVGFGRFTETRLGVVSPSLSLTAALGIALIATIGVVPTYLGIAGLATNTVILLAGSSLAVFLAVRQPGTMRLTRSSAGEYIPVALNIAAAIFHIAAASPASFLNLHDDFYKYLPRLMHLEQTGTLRGTPLDQLGITGAGVQTYLQSYFTVFSGYRAIFAFDFIVCFVLGGLCLDAMARHLGAPLLVRCIVVAAFIIMNPMTVNSSAYYSVLMMMLAAMFYLLVYLDEYVDESGRQQSPNHALMLAAGVLCGVVTAAKFASATLTGMFCLAVAIYLLLTMRMPWAIRSVAALALGALVPFLVWQGLHADKLIVLFQEVTNSLTRVTAPVSAGGTPAAFAEELMASAEISYQGSTIEYAALASTILAIGLAAMMLRRSDSKRADFLILNAVITLGAVAIFFVAHFGQNTNDFIRYNLQSLYIGYWLSLLVVYSLVWQRGTGGSQATLFIIMVCLVWPSSSQFGIWLDRTSQYFSERHPIMIPFPDGEARDQALQYEQNMFSDERLKLVRSLQAQVPKGATLLTYFESGFLLDYSRNPIIHMETPTTFNAINTIQPSERPAWVTEKLQAMNVE